MAARLTSTGPKPRKRQRHKLTAKTLRLEDPDLAEGPSDLATRGVTQFGELAPGGKCYHQLFGNLVDGGIACVDGPQKGELCAGDDSVCDSTPGAGDGACDACPLLGGVTTDDEMFVLLGAYYCVPGSDCDAGVCVGGPNMGKRCDGNNALCPNSVCGGYSN